MRYDTVVVGRPTCDLIFTGMPEWPRAGTESYASGLTIAAGGAFNVAAATSRLGLRVAFVGLLGSDTLSRFVLEQFASEGVSTEYLSVLDRGLPGVSVAFSVNEDRGFVTYESEAEALQAAMSDQVVADLAAIDARHVHVHLAPWLTRVAEAARARGMSLSADAWGWEPWLRSAAVGEVLHVADLLLVNEAEALCLTGAPDARSAAASLNETAGHVVVKCGRKGALAAIGGRLHEVATDCVPVLDATGAGDCFNAGYLYGWGRGLDPETCLVLGNLCGGCGVGAVGGYQGSPTEAELIALARDVGVTLEPLSARPPGNGGE
ncbi:carbohydrate kinase family protein [soil metagenome]